MPPAYFQHHYTMAIDHLKPQPFRAALCCLHLIESAQSLKALFVAFDKETHEFAFKCLSDVRIAGINSEIYPEPVKIKKQLDYADKRQVPFVVIIGSDEMETGQLTLKNMITGEQQKKNLAEIIEILSEGTPTERG